MFLEFLSRSAILTASVLISMASNDSPHTSVSQHITTSSVNLLMFYAYLMFFMGVRYALLKVTGRDLDPNYDLPKTEHHCSSKSSKSINLDEGLDDLEDYIDKTLLDDDRERMQRARDITRDITSDCKKDSKDGVDTNDTISCVDQGRYGRENYDYPSHDSHAVIYVNQENDNQDDSSDNRSQKGGDEEDMKSLRSVHSTRSMRSTAPEPRTLYNLRRPSRKPRTHVYSEADDLWETFRSVYGVGIVIFIASYASDLSSLLPSVALITSMLASALPDIYRMVQDVPDNQTMHVPRLLSFFGYIMTCVGMACFCMTACLNDSLPDSFQFCHKTETPRTDIILGLLLPLASMLLLQQPRSSIGRNRVTLYKASPFAVCIAVCVVTVTSRDNVFHIVDSAPDNLFFFFVVPFTKGLAVISIISACMYRKKVEVATILSFILYCKELHLHKPYKEVLEGLVGALICSTLAVIVLIMKHSKCIADVCSILFDVEIRDP
jgi:hypothetical protein